MKLVNTKTLVTIVLIINRISVFGALSVSLDPSNDKIVDKNETIIFTPTVSGTTGTPDYKWDFGGDGATPPDSTSSSALPVSFSKIGKDYNVILTVTDSLNGKSCSTSSAKVKITLPSIIYQFTADSTGPGSVNWIPSGSRFLSGAIKVKTEVDISTIPVALNHDFGTVSSSVNNTTLDPTTFRSDGSGKGINHVTSNSKAKSLKLAIAQQDSNTHNMLPAQFEDTFLVTYFSTFNEGDYHGPTVADTTQRVSGTNPKRFYYIHSNIPARPDFLGSLAVEGYGYTINKTLLKPISTIRRTTPPNPLPIGTDASYVFDDMVIDSVPGVPLNSRGIPFQDGVSAAVANPTEEIPKGATFDCGDGTRKADDTGPAIGSLHIDAYIIASQQVVNQSTRQNAKVNLISTP